jgi:hypothetical protein
MKTCFEIHDGPREVPAGLGANLPLITIAWRAMRAEHGRRSEQLNAMQEETRRLVNALAEVAEAAHMLRRSVLTEAGGPLIAPLRRIDAALESGQMKVLSPEGAAFSGDLMEWFENIAQHFEPGLESPRVAEVVAPAIAYRGAVVRMGKAVIAVPAPSGAAAVE